MVVKDAVVTNGFTKIIGVVGRERDSLLVACLLHNFINDF